jgi:pimeloyl-ACP methyl ester carboxylesterase
MRWRTLPALAALMLLAADGPAPRPVMIPSADEVELTGDYLPGTRGRQSPCVLLLPDPAAPDARSAWNVLAADLNKQGCAVLRLDLRGTAGSTNVGPGFWRDPFNQRLVRGNGGDTITAADFRRGYGPALVNDLAAAWRFLERVNDASEADCGRTVLVAGGGSAAVALAWLGTEMHRERATGLFGEGTTGRPEGAAVAGVLALDPSAEACDAALPVPAWLRLIQKRRATPLGLLHDAADTAGATTARAWADAAKAAATVKSVAVKHRSRAGLIADPAARALAVNYVRHTLDRATKQPWSERDPDKSRFYWLPRGRAPLVAKQEGQELPRTVPPEWVTRP